MAYMTSDMSTSLLSKIGHTALVLLRFDKPFGIFCAGIFCAIKEIIPLETALKTKPSPKEFHELAELLLTQFEEMNKNSFLESVSRPENIKIAIDRFYENIEESQERRKH